MSEYTPGPWHNDGIGDFEIIADCGETADGLSRSQLVAVVTEVREVNRGEGPGVRDGAEVAANARLIAAAPDLLSYAKEALRMLEGVGQGDSFEARGLAAAIAKAVS